MIYAIGTVFSLVWLVCHVIVLIHAFKSSLLSGFACLCIPCYGIYYLLARFEHPSKGLITIGYLFGGIIGGALHGYNGYSGYSQYMNRSHQIHR
jgi:hypothetical protein